MQNTNINGETGQIDIGNITALSNTIKIYNITSANLRDTLRTAIPIPFHIDPLLHITIRFDEPIPVEELIAAEIFSKHYIEITAVRIIDQSIEFTFNTEDGEDTLEYKTGWYDNVKDIELWQYYLVALVAPKIKEYIEGEIEKEKKLIEFLIKIMEKIQNERGEDNE